MRNIRQNLVFAFLYNVLGVPVAAGVLYPFFGLLLSPMIASAAMTLSSVSVIVNSLRLQKRRALAPSIIEFSSRQVGGRIRRDREETRPAARSDLLSANGLIRARPLVVRSQ